MFSKMKRKVNQECEKMLAKVITGSIVQQKGEVNIVVILGLLAIAAVALFFFQEFFMGLLTDVTTSVSDTFNDLFNFGN